MGIVGAPATLTILLVNVLASFSAWTSREAFHNFAEQPYRIVREGRWYQLITSGFLHADLGHLFFNMLTLFFFGPPMEGVLGTGRFLVLYFGSLFAAGMVSLLFHHRDPTYRAVGASGAVSGVLFGFILFSPLAKIYLFLVPIGIPAILFAIGYLAVSFYGTRRRLGRIGHSAHLGGAIGGILLTILLYPRVVGIFLAHFGL